MQGDIERVLIHRQAIAQRVAELAGQITRDFEKFAGDGAAGANRGGQITIVPILTGSFIFVADLIRQMPLRLSIRLTSVTSYPGTATTSKGAQLQHELSMLPPSLEGSEVLVVDDILDSGNTLRLVCGILEAKNPSSLRTCVLLRKKRPAAMAFPIDYVAFDIPDEFVAGYGLDFDGYYRNLPDIVTLRPEVLRGS